MLNYLLIIQSGVRSVANRTGRTVCHLCMIAQEQAARRHDSRPHVVRRRNSTGHSVATYAWEVCYYSKIDQVLFERSNNKSYY